MAVFKVTLAGRWSEKEGYIRMANDEDAIDEDEDEGGGSGEEWFPVDLVLFISFNIILTRLSLVQLWMVKEKNKG